MTSIPLSPAASCATHRRFVNRRNLKWTGGAALFLIIAVALYLFLRPPNQEDIIKTAYAYEGGGYCALSDSGVPEPVVHQGITILRQSKGGSYCCGFTFLVAMKVAEERGLLKKKQPYEVARFQKEWYGAAKGSNWRQLVLAMENLGIGRQIDPRDARAGDFAVVHRVRGAGHSVIFLDWVKHNDITVGFRYRSSQPSTNGVGDGIEYFVTSGYKGATVDPKHFYVGRLNRR